MHTLIFFRSKSPFIDPRLSRNRNLHVQGIRSMVLRLYASMKMTMNMTMTLITFKSNGHTTMVHHYMPIVPKAISSFLDDYNIA